MTARAPSWHERSSVHIGATMNAILASVHLSPVGLKNQPYFRAFVCSALVAADAHLYIFVSPQQTQRQLAELAASVPRVHVLPNVANASLQHARYENYLSLVRSHGFEKVVLADAFDVVLQEDVFARIEAPGLYVSEESALSYTLGTQRSNALWVSTLYGQETLVRLQRLPVLCSGFTAGTRHAMLVYLRRMAEESRWRIVRRVSDEVQRAHGRDVARGFDQGIHNVLLREGWDAAADGAVRPMDVLTANAQRCNGRGSLVQWNHTTARVCRRSGGCFAAVHQFGRLQPEACRWAVRFSLTCRPNTRILRLRSNSSGTERHQHQEATETLPPYCKVCDTLFPAWLGGSNLGWRSANF